MELVGHILEILKSVWNNLLPFVVINSYEHGVILRLGKFHKTIEGGLIWKIPFIDVVMHCHNTVTTLQTRTQSLTTLDDQTVIVDVIIKYKVSDAKKFLLEVEDSIDAISDITQGKIKELISHLDWDAVRELKDKEITDAVRPESSAWGIKIYYITVTSLTKARVYKLINNSLSPGN